jgi:hypothetical protein
MELVQAASEWNWFNGSCQELNCFHFDIIQAASERVRQLEDDHQ